ncbi:MAG: arginine--tRNA ligase [Promethearchaeota archaeon]
MSSGQASDNPWAHAIDVAAGILAKAAGVNIEVVKENVEIPPDSALGDIATTIAFRLAKERKENPAKIAADIAGDLKRLVDSEPLLDRVEVKGPYINLFLSRGELARLTVGTVAAKGTDFGKTGEYGGMRALIESPAVNPSKPWHIGHARNAVLGDTLGNILESVGYEVIRTDWINDLGLQIAQLVWQLMQPEVPEPKPEEKYDHYLGHLYVAVQEAFEKDKKIEDEIRAVSRDLEHLETEAAKRSERMVTECLKAQCQTGYRLGIYHDLQIWESTIAHSGLLERARDMMLEADSIFVPQEGEKAGCIVADLRTIDEFKDMRDPYKVLFRSDGTRTYTGADVAFQMWKFGIVKDPFQYRVFEVQPNDREVYRTAVDGDDRNLGEVELVFNVIGSDQAHPQKLVYTIMHLLGYNKQSENSHHIAFEFVGLDDADFSGREGTWIGYSVDEVLDKAEKLARDEVDKRNPDDDDEFKAEVAAMIGSGAVRYHLLKTSPDRKIIFRWDDALDFNGDAAPYLQYSYARAQRILEKAEEGEPTSADLTVLASEEEFALVKAIARFPDEVLEVARGLKKEVWGTSFNSNRITSYCYQLATLFTKFYDSCPVLKADPKFRIARLELVKTFKTAMANCLRMIGIPVVERM